MNFIISVTVSVTALISLFLALGISSSFWILFIISWLSLICGKRMRSTVHSLFSTRRFFNELYLMVLILIAVAAIYGGVVINTTCFLLLFLDFLLGLFFLALYLLEKD